MSHSSKKRRRRIPKYCHHKARNLARVTIDGKDHYLGTYNSPESKELYRQLLAEWFDRQQAEQQQVDVDIRLCQLMAQFIKFCQTYYLKNGKLTREYGCISEALRVAREDFDVERVDRFGPRALKTVQKRMIELGWSRKYINKQIGRIVRMFKWGVGEQLVRPDTWQALRAVDGLKKGRTKAPDYEPVEPVADGVVEATLPHLSEIVADMVRVQRLTGCRPGEVCMLRPADVDRSEDVWRFRFEEHKMQHKDKSRIVWIGPKAQRILSKYLERAPTAYCFSPQEAPNARSNSGDHYTKDSYGRAVRRGALKAGVERWSPNRLRHAAATEIRREFGLEAAQVVLGHSSADITQVYAERDQVLAETVARKCG